MGIFKDISGKRSGHLVITGFAYMKKGRSQWNAQCDCGNTIIVDVGNFNIGASTTCGCGQIRKPNPIKRTPLYRVWASMKERCLRPENKGYHRYGGRGVKLCDEWYRFEPFYEWAMSNGYKQGLHLDKDIKGTGLLYSPETCCFVTQKENSRHTRTTKMSLEKAEEVRNSDLSLSKLAKIYSVNKSTIARIKNNKAWMK